MPSVLIADDEEFVRYYLRGLLENMKFTVAEEVENGEDLYEMLKEVRPDMLLLDINMPNLKGNEFLKIYGKTFRNLCIIILTISASSELQNELTQMGYTYFIRKDTPPEEVCRLIKSYWEDFMKRHNNYE